MKKHLCRLCGKPVKGNAKKGATGRCMACARMIQGTRNHKHARIDPEVVRDDYFGSAFRRKESFELYGPHPTCAKCPPDMRCRSYAAPNSRIVYCPSNRSVGPEVAQAVWGRI